MLRLRSSVRRLIAIWLLCRAATLSAAPAAFFVASAGATELRCMCVHGGAHACPMHHGSSARSKICELQNPDHSTARVITWILGSTAGFTPAVYHPSEPTDVVGLAIVPPSKPSTRPVPPDLPPPRS